MKMNLASWDRVGRLVAAVLMLTGAVLAPVSLGVAIGALVVPAVYMVFSALAGTCVGYRLMGYSTCPVR